MRLRTPPRGHPTFERAPELFGEEALVDSVGVLGNSSMPAMRLDTFEVDLPEGVELPFRDLQSRTDRAGSPRCGICTRCCGHVALGVADLDAVLARLAERGIHPDAEPYRVRDGGPRLCLLAEPVEGHLFEPVETG